MNFEKLVTQIMADAKKDGEPLTQAEAEEIAKMEIKAKDVKLYAHTETQKPKAKREVKKDVDKMDLINRLQEYLLACDDLKAVQITNAQREIQFIFKGGEYSITLTKHRTKKK